MVKNYFVVFIFLLASCAPAVSDGSSNTRAKKFGNFSGDYFTDSKLEVDESAAFEGSKDAWNTYLKDNLVYPQVARRLGIEGMVTVIFTVNTDGSLSDVMISRGIGGGCDQEAQRVVKGSSWIPAKVGGKAVSQHMKATIVFKLK